jgi:hypothetical protein
MKWLLRDNFPTIGKKQTQTHTPLQTDQTTVVAQGRRRQDTVNNLFIGQTRTSELALGETLKMMNLQILISLALSVPQNRHLDTLNFI